MRVSSQRLETKINSASKKLVTGPNGIMVAQQFCDIFMWKKDIRYQYINSSQVNCFLSITLKFIFPLVSRVLGGGSKVILVQLCSWYCENTPNAYIAIKWNWNLNLLVITFSTTLTPLPRVVSRNDASPSDGDNKRLVWVRGDQCHDHIKDIRERVDVCHYKDHSCTHQSEEWHHLFQSTMKKWFLK
jgi:hypothetical protein